MEMRRIWSLGGLSLLLIPLFGAAMLPRTPVALGPPMPDTWDNVPWRCPGHLGNDSFPQLAVPGRITNIPEYHDCQRFIVNEKYDSLYAVFVASNAEGVVERLKRLECNPATLLTNGSVPEKRPTEGRVNGLLDRRDTSLTVMGPSFTRGSGGAQVNCRATAGGEWNLVGVALAEIVSWGGDYPSLGIRPYFNCLFIYDSDALKATMVSVGRDDASCNDVIDPSTIPGRDLTVRATSRAFLLPEDYPPVGKWDTDPRTGNLYMGMICGDKWCEVAPEGTTYSRQYTSNSTDRRVRRLREVKGWYDEQRLAEIVNGAVVPSSTFGTFAPSRNLGAYRQTDFNTRTWLRAGTAVLSGNHPKYKDKLNFEGGPRPNVISLCHGAVTKCVPRGKRAQVESCSDDPKHMYAMVASAGGEVRYLCVGYYHHESVPGGAALPIPGTVRWAWYDTDEGGWMRCPTGCCYPT